MKKLIVVLILIPFFLSAQDDAPDLLFELATLTPKAGVMGDLTTAMKHHNDTFHGDNPYGARVYSINSGTEAGKLIWAMGPCTWSDLENRPKNAAHENDWDNNVQPLLESEVRVEYWQFDRNLSFFPADFTLNNLMIRFVDLKAFQEYRYVELIKKAKKVYEEKMPSESFGIYWNELGNSSDGRDLMLVWFFDGLSWMGDNQQFPKLFDEVHGPGSWMNFLKELEGSVVGGDTYLATYMSDMGGLNATVEAAERQ